MPTISAREASRGFSGLLDRVARDAEEFAVVRDGMVIARIVPASQRSVGGFLGRRAAHPAVDDDFAADAGSAGALLSVDTGDPWRA